MYQVLPYKIYNQSAAIATKCIMKKKFINFMQ